MPLLSPSQRGRLEEWLNETGELYVDVYLPHSGGGGTGYFVRTVNQLEELIAKQRWHKLVLAVFRRLQYPLRGVANEAMLAQALVQVPEREWFHLVSLDHYYPDECWWCGSGDTHEEMRQAFREVAGQRVGFGRDPFDKDSDWIYQTADEVMALYFNRRGDHYEAVSA
jgi:hypothetical protein